MPPLRGLHAELAGFNHFGRATASVTLPSDEDSRGPAVPVYANEFWTARQRAAHSLHEISYRACFKPQLPRFFIERLSRPGEVVFDPFMGRGTTLLEAAFHGRVPWGCDVNPLCARLLAPRLSPPTVEEVSRRLREIPFDAPAPAPDELLVFYHPRTLNQIAALRAYLHARRRDQAADTVDGWIEMVALNRLSGHSPGFFSVYTLPPNQAVSVERQRRINATRGQVPAFRSVPELIQRKTRRLLADCDELQRCALRALAARARVLTQPSQSLAATLPAGSVALVVTSPPFLDVVNYAADNWLRGWFAGVDPAAALISTPSRLDAWRAEITQVLRELRRVLRPGGHVAFEVGEVRGGKVRLEETVVPAGWEAGFDVEFVLVNEQSFTKTANCWGVSNNLKGTNSNRVVVLRKPTWSSLPTFR